MLFVLFLFLFLFLAMLCSLQEQEIKRFNAIQCTGLFLKAYTNHFN